MNIYAMHELYTQYILAILLYIAAYAYAMVFAPKITQCGKACNEIEAIHRTCVICTGYSMPGRGKNYYIGGQNDPEEMSKCLVTFWGATHFGLYFLLGIFAPDLFWQTFIAGVLFEVYEYERFDCHDAFDIVLNTAGFFAGKYMRGTGIKN